MEQDRALTKYKVLFLFLIFLPPCPPPPPPNTPSLWEIQLTFVQESDDLILSEKLTYAVLFPPFKAGLERQDLKENSHLLLKHLIIL